MVAVSHREAHDKMRHSYIQCTHTLSTSHYATDVAQRKKQTILRTTERLQKQKRQETSVALSPGTATHHPCEFLTLTPLNQLQ